MIFCVQITYFQLNIDINLYEGGITMRSALFPELTDIYIEREFWKNIVIGTLPLNIWFRYKNENCILWPYQKYLQALLEELKSIWLTFCTVQTEKEARDQMVLLSAKHPCIICQHSPEIPLLHFSMPALRIWSLDTCNIRTNWQPRHRPISGNY